jgi:hypothetical protein
MQLKRILNLKFNLNTQLSPNCLVELIQNDGWIGNVNNTSDLANQ